MKILEAIFGIIAVYVMSKITGQNYVGATKTMEDYLSE